MSSVGFRAQCNSPVALGDPRAIRIEVARLFLGAALEHVDHAGIDRTAERNLSIRLFCLGAIDALAAQLSLDARSASALAVAFFADFFGLDPAAATTLVSHLRALGESVRGRHARVTGHGAMRHWLQGTGQNAQLALVHLLQEPASATAAHAPEPGSHPARETAPGRRAHAS